MGDGSDNLRSFPLGNTLSLGLWPGFGQQRTFVAYLKRWMLPIMNKLTVLSVDPPNEDAASVTLRSEQAEVVAFCWPCDLKVGDIVENRLSVLEADVLATYLSDWPEAEKEELSQEWIERTGHYTYRGRGRVIDQAEGLVEVRGFVIEMPVLSDEYVDFEISRLDLNR
jgi:hypothetical protein